MGGCLKKRSEEATILLVYYTIQASGRFERFSSCQTQVPIFGCPDSPFSRANFAGLEDERIMLLRVCHLILLEVQKSSASLSKSQVGGGTSRGLCFSRYPMCEIFISHSLKRELCALTFCGPDDDRHFSLHAPRCSTVPRSLR